MNLVLACALLAPVQPTHNLYVGTYNSPISEGIYRLSFDTATGKLGEPALAAKMTNPSFVAIHPDGKKLYAVGEVGESGKRKGGAVAAFELSPKGDLKPINDQSTVGGGPCHITLNPDGTTVLVANYGGGSVVSYKVGPDGGLGEPASFIQHKGASVNKQRQEASHAHSINTDPSGAFVYAADLGLDKILIYKLDKATSALSAADPAYVAVAKGSGPRHFCFHPSGKFAFVINELANTITAFIHNPKTGALTSYQTISTLPKDFKGSSYTAEVVAHPSGKFIYGSNRKGDSIAAFTVNPESGTLAVAGFATEGIKEPRNFIVDPTGKWLLVANQNADTIIVFEIDQKTGVPKPTGISAKVGKPVCLRLLATGGAR